MFISERRKRSEATGAKHRTPMPNIQNSLYRPRHDVKLPLSLFKRKGSVQGVPLRSTAPPRQLHRAGNRNNAQPIRSERVFTYDYFYSNITLKKTTSAHRCSHCFTGERVVRSGNKTPSRWEHRCRLFPCGSFK